MDYHDEVIKSYYGPEQAFVEQTKLPLHVHPVFELAVERQLEVRMIASSIESDALGSLHVRMLEITDELDDVASQAGMMDLPVILTGDGIRLPSANIQAATNSVSIGTETSGLTIEELAYSQELRGAFYGFGTRFDVIDDTGATVVRPSIIYQVKVGVFQSPHASGHVYATGDVGRTQVEFLGDYKTRRIADALDTLMQTSNEDIIRAVDDINEALAKSKEPNAVLLKKISRKTDIILDQLDGSPSSQVYIDNLIDLIAIYINLNGRYRLEAESTVSVPRLSQWVNGNMQLYEGNNPIKFSGQISQLVVMPVYTNDKGAPIESPERTLYAAAYVPEASWYFKLSSLSKFEPL